MGCLSCFKRSAVGPAPDSHAHHGVGEYLHNQRHQRLYVCIHPPVMGGAEACRDSAHLDPGEPYAPPTKTMFLLHGVAGSSQIWCDQVSYFTRRGYRVIAPDMIGHGASDTPTSPAHYGFYSLRDDLLTVFDRYSQRDGLNCVMGHSYGCSFAVTLARERSLLVSQLVLISGGAPIELIPEMSVFSLPVCTLDCILPLIRRSFMRKVYSKNSATLARRHVAFSCKALPLALTIRGQRWIQGGHAYHALVDTPTLIVHGLHDAFISVKEDYEMMQTIMNSRMLLVRDTGHMVMLERSSEVNEELGCFLQLCDIPDQKRQFVKTI